MAQPNIAEFARELSKFTKNKSKNNQITQKENNKMAEVSVSKLIKMLNALSKTKKGKHDPKEMRDEDGVDVSIKDEEVIDTQKLDEQEEILRRITKKREV